MRSLILSFNFIILSTLFIGAQSDDCNTATMLGAADLTTGTPTAGATTSDNTASGFWGTAAPLMANACDVGGTFTVDEWYRFDVTANNDITIELTGAGHMAVILEASTANCGTPNMNNFLACHDPATAPSNPQTFHNCFSTGTYYIVILTEPGNEGPYDLTVTEENGMASSAAGDNCAAALALPISTTDGTTITCAANNVNGTTFNNFQEIKGDNLPQAACIEANEATIWYSFTAGDDVYIETTTSANLSIALYSGSCGALTLEQCDANGNISIEDGLVPNTTYYIQVAFPYGDDGVFDFCINSPLLSTPDDCATPEIMTLVDGSTTSAVQMDNLGSGSTTESFTPSLIAACGTGSSMSTNYYQFTIGGAGNTHLNINYNETGATPISNSQITILENCTSTTAFMSYEWTGNTNENVCLMPGTYLIQVASCDLFEGTFTLDLTPNTPPTNDDCTMADLFIDPVTVAPVTEVPAICETYSVSGTTVNACPEPTNLGTACAFDTESTVWYTFTTTAALNQLAEITLTPSGATPIVQGTFALFSGACGATTLVGSCQTDGSEMDIMLTPSTTYFIAVSQDALGMTGTFDLDLEISSIPTNDDCDLGTNPDILSVGTGSTNCAMYDVTSCGIADATMDHQVFYIYSNTSGSTVDLEITIEADASNGNPATQVSITALDDNCSAFTGFYPGLASDSEWCDILGMGMQTLPCIEDGETIILLFGSIEGEEGDFTISAVEGGMQPPLDNDECVDALDITPANTCMVETVMVDNNNACPEDFPALGVCNFNVDPVVWYSFTVPSALGIYQLEISNITGAGSYLTIFDATADCDNITTTAISADCEVGGTGPHNNYDDLTPGNEYLIAFGNPTPGMYSFDIKIDLLPDNDECADAEILVLGTPATNASTICATADAQDPTTICDPVTGESSVWYSYDVITDTKTLTLSLTGLTSGGDVNIMAVDACNSTMYYNDDNNNEVCGTGAADLVIDCPVAGTTIFFMVTTSELEEGDYTLTLTETQTIDVTNDDCANAIDITPAMTCTDLQTTAMTNETACPEDFDIGGCGFDVEEVVWFSIDIPMGATTLDLGINSYAGIGSGFFSLFSECTAPTQIDGNCYTTVSAGDFTATEEIDVTGFVNTTIYVGFGSNGVGDIGGDVVFDIRINIPPANDECAMAEIISGGATLGTTACATQETIPYNGACNDDDETNTVWYQYTVPDGDKGFHLAIAATGTIPFTAPIITSVFETDVCDISNTTLVGMDNCDASALTDLQFECVGPGTYTIMVSTSAMNEGDFEITITPQTETVLNDRCINAEALPAQEQCLWETVDANTENACPEDFDYGSDCGFDDFPVVWYSVTSPADALFLDVALNTGTMPFFAIFPSTIDCDNVTAADALNTNCIVGPIDELGAGNEIPVTENTMYLIAVGSQNSTGIPNLEFELKWITPPDNDECDMAENFDNLTPSGNPGEFSQTLIMETTQCATQNPPLSGSDCDDDFTNTVWYSYTVEPDVKEITIDILNYMNTNTGVGVTPDFTVNAFQGCNDLTFLNQSDGTSANYCGGEGEDLLAFSCLEEGQTIIFLVSSTSLNEGTFDITINTATPVCTYSNDECGFATSSPLTGNPDPLITDDPNDCVLVPGCNDLACTETDPVEMPCGITALNTVFYTFTTDAVVDPVDGAFVNIEITDGEPGELDSPGAVLFEGDCTAAIIGACAGTGGLGTFNSGPLGGPGEIQPNTQYTIMVYNSDPDQNGGTFNLCVTVTSGCVNDDICDAFTLENGVPVTNPASSNNCTDDFELTGCDPIFNSATLWYQVDVPEGASSITITLANQPNADGVGMGTGEVSIAVGPLVDCNNLDVNDILYEDCAGFGTNIHEIPCAIEQGTYWIQIGSDDEMEAGDFTITYEFNMNPDPANDLCSTAEELVINDVCEFIEFPGTLKDACPELFDLDACEYSMNQSVWYTITIPTGDPTITDMDIEILGLASPMIGVFEFDCTSAGDPNANNGVVASTTNTDGSIDCSQMDLTESITVTPGTTYHILVSSSTNEDIAFTIRIKLNAPPINDDPCDTAMNPPLDLTGGGSHAGTTCCARGPKDENPDGSVADLENVDCSDATEDAAVWYTLTPNEDDEGYDIDFAATSIPGNVTIEVYWGAPDAGCNGFGETIASSCTDQDVFFQIPNCPDPGEILFVKVTTDDADDMCGEFNLSIMPAACDDPTAADDCINATTIIGPTMTPPECGVTPPEFDFTGCLDYACPETTIGDCTAGMNPTVWIQIEVDDIAAQMITNIQPNGPWEADWAIYTGPCDAPVLVSALSGACASADPAENHQTAVESGADGLPLTNTYYIAVTAIGYEPGMDGSFTGTVSTLIDCVSCIGFNVDADGSYIAGCNTTATFEVTDRSTDRPLDDLFFCQGEEVTICIDFFYDASQTGVDWLHGMIPNFGPGWDLVNFDPQQVAAETGSEWAEAGGPCAPYLTEQMPFLCTYVDDNGVLQICNTFCNAACPCESPAPINSPLPSGWFWNQPGGLAGCMSECTPSDNYGIGSTQSQINFCIELIVKEFDSDIECLENNDLQFFLQTTSDGVSGCWEDQQAECFLDGAQFSPEYKVDCDSPPRVVGEDAELCDNGTLNIFVQTEDGSVTEIIVEPIPNFNVSGATMFTFPGGTGTIDNTLDNLSTTEQIQMYIIYSNDPSKPCPGVRDTIDVTIYPELMVDFEPVFVCDGDCTDITPDIIGGAGMPFMYEWSTNETTPSINVCPTVPTTYFVTVTDDLGCQDIAEVEVDVKPPVELLLPESIAVCKDDNFDPFNPDYIVCLDFLSGSSPYGIQWVTPIGLDGQPAGVAGECFAINEVTSSAVLGSPSGVYTLTANVTDFFNCMGTVDMEVIITGELTIVTTVNDYECGETETTMNITGIDAAGNPVTTFLLYGGCPDDGLGDFIDEYFSNSGTVLTAALNLLDYTCYTIVAQTESGCQATVDQEIPLTEGTPIDISGDQAICLGDDATITIANEGDYSFFEWTPNIGSSGSVTFTPDSTASYIVEATDALGCVSQEIWTVVVNDLPTVDITGSPEFCLGSSATVTATGGVSYVWSNGGVTGPEYTSSTDQETVTVTATDINGCSSTATVSFSQEPNITINLGNQDICDGLGDTVTINSTYTNISWVNTTTSMEVSDTFFYVVSGPGTFEVTAIDPVGGCDAMGTFTVEEFLSPTINIPDTVDVCRIDSGIDSLCIDLISIASGSSGGTWAPDGIIPGFTFTDFTLDNVCFDSIQTGCYPFTFTTNSAEIPCMDTMATMMVCVKACPCPSPATQGIPDICNLGTENLENFELTTDPGTWSIISGPPTQDLAGILTDKIFNATGILAGQYLVRFTLDNPGGGSCETFSEQTINVIGQELISPIATGQLCNITGQQFPTGLDLFDLIDVDASNGGSWLQTSTGATISIVGGSMISSDGITDFTETFTFEYTSGDTGGTCPATVTEVMVNIFDCTCPILIVGMDTLCNDGLAIDLFDLLTNDDNLPGTWTTNGNLEGTSMFNPDGLASGAYNITYTLDSNPGAGCETEFSNVIIVRKQATAVLADPAPDDPCTMFTGNGLTTVNLYDYLESNYTLGSWSQIGGDMLTFSDDGNSIAIVDFMGQDINEEFMFRFITDGAQEPCVNTVLDITITVKDCNCPPIALSDPSPLCNDAGTLDLCGLIGASDPGSFTVFNQFGNDQSANIDGSGCIFNATDLTAGSYTIIYTLDEIVTGTCDQTDTAYVDVIDYQSVVITEPEEVCNDPSGMGFPMSLNFNELLSQAGNGSWSDDDGANVTLGDITAEQNVSFVGVDAGTYNFTYTIDNADPCPDFVETITVIVTDDCNCAPITPANPAIVCNTDGPIDLTQYDDPDMPGSWSSADLTVENGNSLIIDGVPAGTYDLLYTIDTIVVDCDSTEMLTIMIGEPANPGTALEDLRLCEGDAQMVDLDSRLMDADAGGQWTETSSSPSTGFSVNTFDTDGQAPGTYTFQYAIDFASTDPCPAVDATVTVIIDPNPIADAGGEKFIDCVTTSADLGGENTSTGSDYVYSWTLNGEEVGTTATLSNITVEGTYTLLVTNSVTGCTAESSVTVMKSDDLPTFIVTETDISCNGENDGSIIISDQNGGEEPYMYSLNGGAPVSESDAFNSLAPGEYTISIIDNIGCETEQLFTIIEPDAVAVEIAGEDILTGQPEDEFILTIDPVAENIDSIVWTDFNDQSIIYCSGTPEECTSITLSPTVNTTSVYVEVFDANGCNANDQVQIQLTQIVDVIFPNIITPNGDGVNDFFFVASKDVEQILSMRIFDRWGELIWENSNFEPRDPSKGWDGKFNDSPVVPGVYVFTVDILFNDLENTRESFSGDVTVTDGE